MSDHGWYAGNDGRYPDDSAVEVRYPPAGANLAEPRSWWPWMPGTVLGQCGPNEWHIAVEVRELATLEDGSAAPDGTPDEDLYYPAVYRDGSEIRKPRGTDGV